MRLIYLSFHFLIHIKLIYNSVLLENSKIHYIDLST